MSTIVGILAFEGISPFHLSVPCLIFGDATSRYEVKVCAEMKSSITVSSGFSISTPYTLKDLAKADIVIIPSWPQAYHPPSPQLIDALLSAYANGSKIIGLCLGAYVLAAAGLLDGHQATTHWAFAEDFSKRFPKVTLNSNVLYLDDGNIVTSAGTAAGIDCCLNIIRQDLGSAEANRIARLMVVPPQRTGGQAQYIDIPIPERVGDQRIAKLMDKIRGNLGDKHTIDTMAKEVALSRRTFTRRFHALTGKSVGQWILEERLRFCQQLLEESNLSIELIAEKAGFGSTVNLRHHFRQVFKTSPSQWRQTFRY